MTSDRSEPPGRRLLRILGQLLALLVLLDDTGRIERLLRRDPELIVKGCIKFKLDPLEDVPLLLDPTTLPVTEGIYLKLFKFMQAKWAIIIQRLKNILKRG